VILTGDVATLGPFDVRSLMERGNGNPDVRVALVDGPVMVDHPDLTTENIIGLHRHFACTSSAVSRDPACLHGTFIAGILSARRESSTPGICPGCSLLIRPVLMPPQGARPESTPRDLAAAIVSCAEARAWIINLSVGFSRASDSRNPDLEDALHFAASRGVVVVAATGNTGSLASTPVTRHPWVIPVVACDMQGQVLNDSDTSGSVAKRGLTALGEATSLGPIAEQVTLRGTSVAAAYVTGAIALLWSEFPSVSATDVRLVVAQSRGRRRGILPPVLYTEEVRRRLSSICQGRVAVNAYRQ
jgi:subtilisin family serine protease